MTTRKRRPRLDIDNLKLREQVIEVLRDRFDINDADSSSVTDIVTALVRGPYEHIKAADLDAFRTRVRREIGALAGEGRIERSRHNEWRFADPAVALEKNRRRELHRAAVARAGSLAQKLQGLGYRATAYSEDSWRYDSRPNVLVHVDDLARLVERLEAIQFELQTGQVLAVCDSCDELVLKDTQTCDKCASE